MTARAHPAGRLLLIGLCAALLTGALVGLGIWQIHRMVWKHALIARVERRIHAPPVAAPGVKAWPGITQEDAYLRVRARGFFLRGHDALVQAVSVKGPGYWVMTPLRSDRGFMLLVNRGFVPTRQAPAPPDGAVTVTGLLRVSEPGGGFLRANLPRAGRWYSRDVTAIARAQRVGTVAPYFIDADNSANAGRNDARQPLGGLTMVNFPDNHLPYALTWFTLALMTAVGGGMLLRDGWRSLPRRDRLQR